MVPENPLVDVDALPTIEPAVLIIAHEFANKEIIKILIIFTNKNLSSSNMISGANYSF